MNNNIEYSAYAQVAITKIARDMLHGRVRADVRRFSELHDDVDANEYIEFMVAGLDEVTEADCQRMNAVMAEVDKWLVSTYEARTRA